MIDPVNGVQIATVGIVDYIREMGIDPLLFTIMTAAGPNEIVILKKEEMEQLKILNGSVFRDEWKLKAVLQGTYFVGAHEDDRGISKMAFACDNGKLHSMIFIPEPSEQDARRVIDETTGAGYFVNNTVKHLEAGSYKIRHSGNEIQVAWVANWSTPILESTRNRYVSG